MVLVSAVALQSGHSLAADKVVVIPLNTGGGAPAGQSCSGGEYVYGFDASGNILCSSLVAKTVFATKATYTGDLGGVAGAHDICQAAATDAGLSGIYKAWISDATSSPSTTFVRSVVPYVTTAGDQIAADWTDLIDSTLTNPIDKDEHGDLVGTEAWTYTNPDGTKSTMDVVTRSCNQWTSDSDYQGVIGWVGGTDSSWTLGGYQGCDYLGKHHLYCFQQ